MMKKTSAMLLALTLGLFLLTGSGVCATVEEDFFSYTPPTDVNLKNYNVEVKWRMMKPEELLTKVILPAFPGERKDDVTIAGITYTVLKSGEHFTFLVAPLKNADKGSIEIKLNGIGIEGAMPVLESIKLK